MQFKLTRAERRPLLPSPSVEWLFIAGLSLGIPLVVPPTLRALDAADTAGAAGAVGRSAMDAFAGAALTVFGMAGLLALGFSIAPTLAVVSSGALGIAAGALHPDLVRWLQRRRVARELGETNAEYDV